MVRCLSVLFVLALLLCGCAGESTELPDNTTQPVGIIQDTPSGLYVPKSPMEQATGGAVKTYDPKMPGYYGCIQMGDKVILLHKEEDEGILSLHRADTLEQIKYIRLGKGTIPEVDQMQINDRGIGYFDSARKSMVFLNKDLMEIGRMSLPEDMDGNAWLTPDWKTVYYCSAKGICTMDMQSGISRLLKEQDAFRQELTGVFGNGDVLRYELERTEGETAIQLLDAKSGMILLEGEYLNSLRTRSDKYFVVKPDRKLLQMRFGKGEDHKILWPAEASAYPHMLFDNNAIVMSQIAETQTDLAYYDLATGKRLGEVVLPDITEIWGLTGDGQKGVWLFGKDVDGKELLYHWSADAKPGDDENVYAEPWYTPESVDTEGLAQRKLDAAALGEKYGVEILIFDDAAKTAQPNYVFTQEYITRIYDLYLPELEELLQSFPKEFFSHGLKAKVRFALVQKITGEPTKGGLAQSGNLQFWEGEVPVIALVLDENLKQNFCHGVYHCMETRLLSKSSALYEWHKYNPKGFAYDNSYLTNLDRTDMTYVEGEKRYFIDLFSMSYAREDRARIFEYACMPGNEELFKIPAIQTKLQRICKGIREAYELKKVETVFPWEQYLKK